MRIDQRIHAAQILTVIALTLLFAACSLSGPQVLANETYDLGEFSALQVDGIGQVTITQGEANSLTLIAEPSILEKMTYSITGDTLYLGFADEITLASLDPQSGIQMILTVKGIQSIDHAGSCNIVGTGLSGKTLELTHDGVGSISLTDLTYEAVELDLSGSGSVVINGAIDKQSILMSGSVRYFGSDTPTRMINAELDGHTQASVWVTEILNVETGTDARFEFFGVPPEMYLGRHPENVQMAGQK